MTHRVLPAIVVVVVANAVSLALVAANRRGGPDTVITLTERELRLVYGSERDSAQRVELEVRNGYRSPNQPDVGEWDWLTAEKLTSLGFACRAPRDADERSWFAACGLARRVFVSVEYDGAMWRRLADALRRARDKTLESVATDQYAAITAESIDHQIKYGTRLVVVDASLSASGLRQMYPDRNRFLILPARLSAWKSLDRRKDPNAMPTVGGTVQLVTERVVAPARYRDLLLKLGPSAYGGLAKEPRYSVKLAVGGRYQPWIVSIDTIDSPPPRQ